MPRPKGTTGQREASVRGFRLRVVSFLFAFPTDPVFIRAMMKTNAMSVPGTHSAAAAAGPCDVAETDCALLTHAERPLFRPLAEAG